MAEQVQTDEEARESALAEMQRAADEYEAVRARVDQTLATLPEELARLVAAMEVIEGALSTAHRQGYGDRAEVICPRITVRLERSLPRLQLSTGRQIWPA